ncbi:MAG: hypothetical protein J0L92_31310 [Deltaproteobacteria bacterium]|nr:hypothetical protein [Deltaproteobacteria bacterium]
MHWARTIMVGAWLLTGCACEDGLGARRDAGRRDAPSMDAAGDDTSFAHDATAHDVLAVLDAPSAIDGGEASDARTAGDAGTALDAFASADTRVLDAAGCEPGESRACSIDCGMGASAPGRQICLGGDAWSVCDRVPETCMNTIDDDADGRVDEGCREEGGCLWIRASCQGLGTLNQVCARSGRPRLVEGRRCPVAGGTTTPLDAIYGEYQLACCDVASTCRPECTSDVCASSVVWDEIRCCP